MGDAAWLEGCRSEPTSRLGSAASPSWGQRVRVRRGEAEGGALARLLLRRRSRGASRVVGSFPRKHLELQRLGPGPPRAPQRPPRCPSCSRHPPAADQRRDVRKRRSPRTSARCCLVPFRPRPITVRWPPWTPLPLGYQTLASQPHSTFPRPSPQPSPRRRLRLHRTRLLQPHRPLRPARHPPSARAQRWMETPGARPGSCTTATTTRTTTLSSAPTASQRRSATGGSLSSRPVLSKQAYKSALPAASPSRAPSARRVLVAASSRRCDSSLTVACVRPQRRKIKCDRVMPVCGNCTSAFKSRLASRGPEPARLTSTCPLDRTRSPCRVRLGRLPTLERRLLAANHRPHVGARVARSEALPRRALPPDAAAQLCPLQADRAWECGTGSAGSRPGRSDEQEGRVGEWESRARGRGGVLGRASTRLLSLHLLLLAHVCTRRRKTQPSRSRTASSPRVSGWTPQTPQPSPPSCLRARRSRTLPPLQAAPAATDDPALPFASALPHSSSPKP